MTAEAIMAIFVGVALVAIFVLLLWGIARGSRRMLGTDTLLGEAVERCAACGERPVCETGALAGWLRIRPASCPNLELLQKRKPL